MLVEHRLRLGAPYRREQALERLDLGHVVDRDVRCVGIERQVILVIALRRIEAAERIDKDKTPHFDVIVMVGSDLGNVRFQDRDYVKLQQTIFNHGVTTHVALTVGSSQSETKSWKAQRLLMNPRMALWEG